MTHKKMKTEAAQTAKEIRKKLKTNFPDVKFSVTSENFSMGDAVNVEWTDGVSEEQVKEIIRDYQEGHFDGMIDLYEYSNSREDIPQVKYLSLNRELSEETVRKFAKKFKEDYEIDESDENLYTSFTFKDRYVNWFQLAFQHLYEKDLRGGLK